MKVISLVLFHFTFIVVAMTQGFFEEDGAFRQKLNPDKIDRCLTNCSNYVAKDSCGSICTKNQTQYSDLMEKVYKRLKEPLCDLDLGNISFGEVKIPLAIDGDSRSCYLKGPLNVEMKNITQYGSDPDYLCVTTKPRYGLPFYLSIAFRGLSVYCASCPSMTPIQRANDSRVDSQLNGRVYVHPNFIFRCYVHFVDPKNPTIELDRSVVSPMFVFPDGDPKDISYGALYRALSNAFEAADVRDALGKYLMSLSTALLKKCIIPTCNPNCPK